MTERGQRFEYWKIEVTDGKFSTIVLSSNGLLFGVSVTAPSTHLDYDLLICATFLRVPASYQSNGILLQVIHPPNMLFSSQ